MSGMVMAQTRELLTCQLGMPRWSISRRPASAGIGTWFHGGPSSPRSNAFRFVQELLGADTHGGRSQVFSVPLEKSLWVPLSELSVLGSLSDTCSLSGTGTGDGTLLTIFIYWTIYLLLYLFIYFQSDAAAADIGRAWWRSDAVGTS